MAEKRLTNNSSEADLRTILGGDPMYVIPYFQRAYKWKKKKLEQLEKDILSLVDEASDFHFMGAIIIHGRRVDPSEPRLFDVIDGQQRITTLFIYLTALIKKYALIGDIEKAAGLFDNYLAIHRCPRQPSNFRLHSCKDDRKQFSRMMEDLLANEDFRQELDGFKPRYLPKTGDDRGPLWNNYQQAQKFIEEQYEEAGKDRIDAIMTALVEKMKFVQIDVFDPTDGPKIFDALNSLQEPMTIGDLVRNEIFSKVADQEPHEIEVVDQEHWQPFYQRFSIGGRNYFDRYFFPYGLIKNPSLQKSEVYSYLREEWSDVKDPDKIISELEEYQNAFLDLVAGKSNSTLPKDVSRAVRRFYDFRAPGACLPFVMKLVHEIERNHINPEVGLSSDEGLLVLESIESFLVRRAIVGIEPTGLHAVFKKLWFELDGDISSDAIKDRIRQHTTVQWPNESSVKDALMNRPMYGAGVTAYILASYDESLGGDRPNNVPEIEHILPKNPDNGWWEVFERSEHKELKDLIGNLIPLSSKMNQEIQNSIYVTKRQRYLDDSMFKSARELAERNSSWTPSDIKLRCEKIADWAVKRWKY